MKKALRKTIRIGAVVASLLIFAVAAAVIIFLFDKPVVKSILEKQLSKRAGIGLRISKLDYSFFPLRLTVEGLEVGQENDFYKIGLLLTRLEAKGDTWKLVRGRKPAIETIEAGSAVFRLEQKAVPKEPVDLEALIGRASSALTWVGRISVANASVTASLVSQDASAENLDISVATGNEESGISYTIRSPGIEIKDKRGAHILKSGLAASGTLRTAPSPVLDAVLSLDSAQVAAAEVKASLAGIAVEATGRFGLAAKEVTISRFKISVPDLFDLEGTAGGRLSQDRFLEVEATAQFDKLENVAALIRPRLRAEFFRSQIRGRAVLSGKYKIRGTSKETMADSLAGSVAFQGVEIDHFFNGLPLRVRASGKIRAAGTSRAPRISADISSSIGKIVLGNLGVGSSDLHIVAAATKENANISRLDALFKDLVFKIADGKRLSFERTTLSGKASLDLGRKTMVMDSLEVRFPGLSPLLAWGRFELGKKQAGSVRIETRGLEIPALRSLAAPFIPESFAGWDLGGAADLSLEVRRPDASGPDWGFSGAVSLTQTNINDPSFTIASEGINPALKVEGTYGPSTGFSFRGDLDISQGESLWKSVYVPWSKHPLKMTASALFRPGSGGVDGLEARFVFPTIGEVQVSGWVKAHPFLSFELRSDAHLSLEPLYSLYSQAGVSQGNQMTINGMLGAGLLIKKKGNDLSVAGRLTLTGTNIERTSTKTRVLDVDADIPVHYESGTAAAVSLENLLPEEGFLRVGKFQNPFMALESAAVSLRAGANAFSIEPFAQELFGGRMELGRTTFRFDPKTGWVEGTGSLALRDIDISRFPIQSPQFRLTGKVQADFPRLDISSREVAVSGRGEADVFGGKVILRDLSISNPFTPGRSISLNIDLLDLNLKKLTQEVPFGEVTGIVRGEVRNLVISYRQPERFEFRIESVPRKGVAQTFSLKAVDNLSVLSSGQQATGGTSRFWTRIIRGFRYQKIGIVSTLRNDTFTLNGTIHEGGVEYLVKKTALSGISVVNRMPKNVISFKEMASRLKRVGHSEK